MQTHILKAAWIVGSVGAVSITGVGAGAPPARVAEARGIDPHAGARLQNGLVGRYVLRSVNGQQLPAAIPGEDIKHKVKVVSGVLDLRQNGNYVCQTVSRATYLGYVREATDTLHGVYGTIGGGYVTFGYAKNAPNGSPIPQVDTVPTGGFQISWHHVLRRDKEVEAATFVYSK